MSELVSPVQPVADLSSRAFPSARHWCWLGAALTLFIVAFTGSRGLNEPDEGRYANIALAMAKPGGSWWEPRESGFAHYDKPPLIYWATALSFRALGVNEWAARVPSLLGAALALTGLAWAATRLHDARTAWWAVLICGTSAQFWVLSHVLSPDFLMTGWVTLAIAAWAECRHRGGAWVSWLVCLLFWALGWWTKATPALVPLVGLLVGICVTGDRAGRRALRIWLLAPAIILLGSPWYLSMLHRYPELSRFFFHRELAGRMAGRVDGRHASKFYYLPVSLVAWLPWWPFSLCNTWRAGRLCGSAAAWCRRVGVEGWILLVGLVVFSLANSKLPTYTLPLAPWAALLIARGLLAGARDAFSAWRLAPALVFAPAAIVAIAFVPTYKEARLGPNSSLRPVARYLLAHEAREVDADHYWPGLEFYLDNRPVHFVVHINDSQQERHSDPGLFHDRFVDPMDWLNQDGRPNLSVPANGERWLVRFKKNRESNFDSVLTPERREKVASMGDFDLFHVTLAAGQPAPTTDAPSPLPAP